MFISNFMGNLETREMKNYYSPYHTKIINLFPFFFL